MQTKSKKINISGKYFDEIEKIVANSTQFETVSDYVDFVLQELLYGKDDLSPQDQEALQKRMRDLGYL